MLHGFEKCAIFGIQVRMSVKLFCTAEFDVETGYKKVPWCTFYTMTHNRQGFPIVSLWHRSSAAKQQESHLRIRTHLLPDAVNTSLQAGVYYSELELPDFLPRPYTVMAKPDINQLG